MSGIGRLLVATLLAGVLTAGLMMPYFLGAGLASNKVTAAIADVQAEDFDQPAPERTRILDASGKVITYLYDQNRQWVDLPDISERLQRAVIAIEDRRYLAHGGFDPWGTTRALLSGNGGGSTITQQYVKNYLFLVKAKTEAEKAAAIEPTPIRKLREAKLSIQLDQRFSKDDILEKFLNTIAFGPSTYGAEAASQRYFSVSAADLSLPQAALLAGMINNPNRYNPITQQANAVARRNLVLDTMAATGAISQRIADQAKNVSLQSTLKTSNTPNGCSDKNMQNRSTYGYYCQYVLDYLRNNGFDSTQLTTGGYIIRTNLDPAAMKAAKQSVDKNANPSEAANKRVANVLAVVQPGASTRKVVAMAANRPYGLDAKRGQTVQRLTTTFAPLGAGSTFKVFTAAAALELGMGTQSVFGVPAEYISPLSPSHTFRNSATYPATVTMEQALSTSPNTTFVRLEDNIGLDKVVQMSVELGLKGYQLDAGEVSPQFAGAGQSYAEEVVRQKIASYTLGVSPVSPLELANVGATLASEGMWCPPSPVDTVTDRDGALITWDATPCEQAVEPQLANTLARAMEEDIKTGTSSAAAKAAGWDRIAAGKTGTTQDYKSSAYLGFTPQYSGAVMVWDYLPKPTSICRDPLRSCTGEEAERPGQGMSGGSVPAATWFDAMKTINTGGEKDFGTEGVEYVQGRADNQIDNFRGKTVDEATAALEAKGFAVTLRPSSTTGAARNIVVEQNPEQGEAALPGVTTVVLTVSTGGEAG